MFTVETIVVMSWTCDMQSFALELRQVRTPAVVHLNELIWIGTSCLCFTLLQGNSVCNIAAFHVKCQKCVFIWLRLLQLLQLFQRLMSALFFPPRRRRVRIIFTRKYVPACCKNWPPTQLRKVLVVHLSFFWPLTDVSCVQTSNTSIENQCFISDVLLVPLFFSFLACYTLLVTVRRSYDLNHQLWESVQSFPWAIFPAPPILLLLLFFVFLFILVLTWPPSSL